MTEADLWSGAKTEGPWRELRLDVRVDVIDGVETPQLVPRVDGSVLLLELDTRDESPDSGLGMDPDELLGRHGPLLPPEDPIDVTEKPPRATVWRCSCGEPGDASIGVRVDRAQHTGSYDAVVWDDWYMAWGGHDDVAAPPALRFDSGAYYAELIRATADRWWENVPHAVARRLSGILDARPELLARWGTALLFARGSVTEGAGEIVMWLRHATGRYELTLSCPVTAEPDEQTRRIVERLDGADPASWPECTPLWGL